MACQYLIGAKDCAKSIEVHKSTTDIVAHAAPSGTEFGGDYHFWNYLIPYPHSLLAFQVAQVVKNPPASAGDAGDLGSIPGAGRPPRGGNGHPLQYSCLGNPMDRGAWRTAVHGVTKSQTRLSTHTHTGVPNCASSGKFLPPRLYNELVIASTS